MPQALHVAGKLGCQACINAVTPSSLVHVEDQISKRRFLCDTGASYSMLPHHSQEAAIGPRLRSAGGGHIQRWGEHELTFSLNGKLFTWIFLLAEVEFPILGIDFFKHFQLVIDARARQLVDTRTLFVIPAAGGKPRARGEVYAAVGSAPPGYRDLLVEFQAVLNHQGSLPPSVHRVEHHLPTTGRPVTARFRRLDPEKHQAAKAVGEKMVQQGVARRSSSCWASPLHMVKKIDGSWRPCGDYRQLNLVTTPDKYPLPRMEYLSTRLLGCEVFSKLDLKQRYDQIPMAADDVKKTAVITPFGLFEFVRMPFGLRNAGQSFQRMMDVILEGIPSVFCYMDDILVASPNHAAHQQDLCRLLTALQTHGLVLNIEKCVFAREQVEFLGHLIDTSGARPLVSNVAAVQDFLPPTTVRELQQFLGMVNFYRRFLPRIAKVLVPLMDLLKGGRKGAAPVHFSPAAMATFEAAKTALCDTAVLAHPDATAELSLMTDASESHVGAVLQQHASPSSPWRPLGFFSKKLTPTQARYSAFDRKLWAVFSSIRHFRYMLEGRSFCVLTDHKPLTAALGRKTEPWSAKQ